MRVPVVARGRRASPQLRSALRALGHVPVEVDPRGLLSLVADLTLPSVVVFDGAPRELAADLAELRATEAGALLPALVALDEPDIARALSCLEAGADDVLPPPVTADAVALRLAALLRRPRPPRDAWAERVDRGLVSTVLDALACPVVVTSRAGVVEHFNRESEALSGVPASEVLGTRLWRSLVPSDEAERFDEVHARVVAGEASVEYEGDWRGRDGERHRIAWRVSSLRDAGGDVAHVLAAGIDVTERERARRQLAASESTLRSLFDSAPFIMGIVERGEDSAEGPEYTIVAGNGAFSRTFGISPEALVGARARDLPVPREALDLWLSRLDEAGDAPFHFEYSAAMSASPRRLGVTLARVAAPPGAPPTRRTCFVIEDITERAQIQSQLLLADRLVSMGTLAAGVAHEINNPLMYVMTNLEFLSRHLDASGDASRRARHAVEQAREGAERVRQIVRNLRTFSRGDDDRRGPVSVTQVLESALEMAHNEIRHRARVVRDFDVVPPVEANEARLGQVFLNLLVNAAQAIPDEGPSEAHEVRVTLRHDVDRGRIVASVRDTGHGIDPDVLPRVFDPFFTTKPVGEGTGLGLAIVHGIVRSLGGDIEVESTPGSGSEFRVYLPVATQPPAPRRKSVPPPPSGARLRVLIIDDEPNLRSSLALIVGGDHDAFTEGSGRDALARVESGERFDVILCDLMMPEVSGLDVYETLERVAPDQARRVVFLTGGAFTPRAQEFLSRVPNPRLEKPFDLDELQRIIRKVGGAAPAPIPPQ